MTNSTEEGIYMCSTGQMTAPNRGQYRHHDRAATQSHNPRHGVFPWRSQHQDHPLRQRQPLALSGRKLRDSRNPTESVLRAEGVDMRDFAIEAEERSRQEKRRELERLRKDLEENCVEVRDFACFLEFEDADCSAWSMEAAGDADEAEAEAEAVRKEDDMLWNEWFGKAGADGGQGRRA